LTYIKELCLSNVMYLSSVVKSLLNKESKQKHLRIFSYTTCVYSTK